VLRGSETWIVKNVKELAVEQQAEMRMIRSMCGVNVRENKSYNELKERLETDGIITLVL